MGLAPLTPKAVFANKILYMNKAKHEDVFIGPWELTLLFYFILFLFYFIFVLCFRAAPGHTEVPRLGVKSELQLLAYATATATPDLSRVCNLHHSSRQYRILNPLSEARD